MIAKGKATFLARASRLYAATNTIDLSALNGTNGGFRLDGVAASDRAG